MKWGGISVMRSAASLTYGGVARALGFTEQAPQSASAEQLKRELFVMDELARKLRRRRLRRGALDLDLPEARVSIDETTGAPIDIIRRATDEGTGRAYQIIEELMVLANELVARWLSERHAPAIYRVHGKPDEQKLEQLAEAAATLGVPLEPDQLLSPAGVTQWLRRIREHPRREVLETLLLRAMQQAYYDITNIGHFGLASDAYLHFTSPIRRYPDLEVHRAVKRLLRGDKADTSAAAVESLRAKATMASARERATLEVEREAVDLYRAILMTGQIGERFDGTIVAVTAGGIYVSLDHPFVDVLVRYDSLGPDHYEASEDELSVVGLRSGDRLRLGDRIVVQIEDAAVLRRTVYARRVLPSGVAAKSARPRGQRTRGAGSGGRGRTQRSEPSVWDDTPQPIERGAFPAARASRPTGSAKPTRHTSRGRSTRRRGPGRGKRRG